MTAVLDCSTAAALGPTAVDLYTVDLYRGGLYPGRGLYRYEVTVMVGDRWQSTLQRGAGVEVPCAWERDRAT